MPLDKKLLEKKIKEYDKLEKYFGTDKKGNILYDEYKDQELAMQNLEKGEEYVGFNDFVKWIEGKSKHELVSELQNLTYQDDKQFETIKETAKVVYPSGEQKAIIDSVTSGKNVMVDAVAGSGKTTTVMFIAQQDPKKKILQITYNKQLKLEVREKVQRAKIENLEIHTYHSLAVKYYDKDCFNDDKIIKLLSNNNAPRSIKHYDIIIVDEVQDMTPNYFSLVCKLINDMKLQKATLLLLGDRYQGIYDFKDADTRFLVYSDKIWNDSQDFVKLPMQESFRVTKQIAWFVNKAMLGQDRITSNKEGKHKVYYYRKNKFAIFSTFAQKIAQFLKEGYKPSDIFILAPSLKSVNSNNPIKKLENKLVEMNIPVYFSRNEEEGLDEDIIKGKVVFTTFHQSKGRERKICIVFGFDASYFRFYNKDKDPNVCPSELYVALTRASEVLVLSEADDEEQLDFMKLDHARLRSSGMVDFIGNIPKELKKKPDLPDDIHKTSVTELTAYIGEENSEKLIDLLNNLFKTETEPSSSTSVEIPSNIKTENGKTEDVSDINGLIIPAMFEHKRTGMSALQRMINDMYEDSSSSTQALIKTVLNTKISDDDSLGKFLCMGNLFIALTEKIHSKLSQIDKYKWLTNEMVAICHKNLKNCVGKNPMFEYPLGKHQNEDGSTFFHYVTNTFGDIQITSRVDCVDDKTLWEFKCVSILQNEHLLQLVVYAWIWEKCMKEQYGKKKFKILNIRTGEVKVLKYENYYVEEIMSILFSNKYYKKPKGDDKEFIEKCNKVRNKISTSVNKPLEKSLFEFGGFSDRSDDSGDAKMSFGDMFGGAKSTKSKTVNKKILDSDSDFDEKPKKVTKKKSDEKPKKVKKGK